VTDGPAPFRNAGIKPLLAGGLGSASFAVLLLAT